uniref:Uncharacterized protein n=1 Tax=Physcomitrium patens TaxID=3218 RepID=A0A2K1JT24_PHYPA|nr:hypothetical protein PHYPA_014439 [Physcomitrium patens]
MASANVSNHAAAPVAAEKTHLKQQTNAEEPAVAPETTRFPKDVDGASSGPVWQNIAVPLKADPANNPSSEEWDQAKQAFKDTGLLKRLP